MPNIICCFYLLQNHWRWVLALAWTPNATLLRHLTQNIPTYLTLKFALLPTQNLKFALAPTPTPNASQWNIGGVGPSGVGAGIGHAHFRLFVSISFAFGGQRKRSFQ